MISGIRNRGIYLKPGPTDMRKQINGLATMAQEILKRDPFSGSCFMFCGRRRNILKILYWDDTGFCLWTKRLEKDRFPWPRDEAEVRQITAGQLRMLLAGIDFWRAHRKLEFKKVC